MAEHTFTFVDMAGFTAATETHGDEMAADLAAILIDASTRALGSHDRMVKSIGDAVLCASPDPAAALDLVVRLTEDLVARHEFPLCRIGLHHGSASERDGDFFGGGVNVAARVAAQAGPGQVLATAQVAAAARAKSFDAIALGPVRLRNLADDVELFEIVLPWCATGVAIDPVCRMQVDHARAAARVRHEGVELWFCSLDCVGRFAADPSAFTPTG